MATEAAQSLPPCSGWMVFFLHTSTKEVHWHSDGNLHTHEVAKAVMLEMLESGEREDVRIAPIHGVSPQEDDDERRRSGFLTGEDAILGDDLLNAMSTCGADCHNCGKITYFILLAHPKGLLLLRKEDEEHNPNPELWPWATPHHISADGKFCKLDIDCHFCEKAGQFAFAVPEPGDCSATDP